MFRLLSFGRAQKTTRACEGGHSDRAAAGAGNGHFAYCTWGVYRSEPWFTTSDPCETDRPSASLCSQPPQGRVWGHHLAGLRTIDAMARAGDLYFPPRVRGLPIQCISSSLLKEPETLAGHEIGAGGIRTLGTVTRTPHFQCGPFSHSDTAPRNRHFRRFDRTGSVPPICRLEQLQVLVNPSSREPCDIRGSQSPLDKTTTDTMPHSVRAKSLAIIKQGQCGRFDAAGNTTAPGHL